VRAQAAGEKSVAVRDVYDRILVRSGHGQTSGHTFAPHGKIVSGIAGDLRLARGTRGSLDPDDFLHRLGKEPGRIVGGQILLGGKRQSDDVGKRLDVLRLYSCLIHLLSVRRHIGVNVRHCLLQSFQLQCLHGIAVGAFHLSVPDHLLVSSCCPALIEGHLIKINKFCFDIFFYHLLPLVGVKRQVS